MTAALMLLVVAVPGALLPQLALGVATLAHSGWQLWCVLRWRNETIVVTDQRIIRVHGVLTLTADSVQLEQITDTTLRCTLAGRLLGYGTLRIESAGQRRAVERIDHLPHPDAVYRATLTGLHTGGAHTATRTRGGDQRWR